MSKELTMIAGPMNSGKSTELIQKLRRSQIAGKAVIIFKPYIDNRAGEKVIASKDGPCLPAISIEKVTDLRTTAEQFVLEHLNQEVVIGIDEIQFFGAEIVDQVQFLTEFLNCEVIAAGLARDFKREPFGPMPILLALAQNIEILTAICTYSDNGKICGQPATETQRLINGVPADYRDPVILVGDIKDGYCSRCLTHHEVKNQPIK